MQGWIINSLRARCNDLSCDFDSFFSTTTGARRQFGAKKAHL